MRSRIGMVLLLAAATVVLLGTPAFAHASLVSTEPGDGEALEAAPQEVRLTFNEPIAAPEGAIRVYDARGSRVDAGDARVSSAAPEVLVASLDRDLADGTYVVAWRAISADRHPISGAFVFAVGDHQVDHGLLQEILAGEDGRAVAAVATGLRGLTYVATLIAAGAAGYLLLVSRERGARIAVLAAIAATAFTVLGIPAQAALETGLGFEVLGRPGPLAATATGSVGLSALVRLGGLAILGAALLGARPRAGIAAVGGAVAVGSFLLTGHTVTSDPRWLVVGATAAHVGAAAIWFGGLVVLAAHLRDGEMEPQTAASHVSRFSSVAAAALVVVAAGGLALAWVEVRALRALATPYGTVLLVKVGVVALVLAVAAYNRWRLVPQVSAARAGGAGRLRRTVRVEAVGLVLVLLVTGALVYLQPARDAAGVTGVFSTYEDVGDEHEVNLVVDPNRAGRNEIHLYVLHRETFRPLSTLAGAALRLELSFPAEEIGPIVREPQVAGPGHWLHVGDELAIPGRWEITVIVRIDEFDEARTTIPVTVNP